MATTSIIQTHQLSHHYGDVIALQDVNLTVQAGEIFGFLGPNGSGKTTLIRTLMDYIRPTSGSATVFGKDVRQHSLAIRRDVGYLPSELSLWKNTTGTRLMQWASTVYGRDLLPEARQLAERVQFDLDRSLAGMSTGMKRKMGLILTFAHHPKLLILDEPTIGLDPLIQEVFHELALEAKSEGRTIFMSSHSLPEVQQLCDRVGIIRAGELQAVETVEKLTRVGFRWMTVTYDDAMPADALRQLDGISDVSTVDHQLRMKVSRDADMNRVLQTVLGNPVVDLQFETPSLEEIFLSYYGTTNDGTTETRSN